MDELVRRNRIQCILALVSCLIVVVCVCISVTMNLTTIYDEDFDNMGIRTFCMFTVNSNILSAISSFVHPMRLTFVEFFKNAGFEMTSRAFKPLKKEIK